MKKLMSAGVLAVATLTAAAVFVPANAWAQG